MIIYARIQNNEVAELFTPPPDASLDACFVPSVAAQFVDVSNVDPRPEAGWSATLHGSVWSFSAPSMPTPTLAQQAAAACLAGVTISLSGSTELGSTLFSTDEFTRQSLSAVLMTLMITGSFPGDTVTYPLRDTGGTWHAFTTAQYKAVAGAILTYIAALSLIMSGNPLGATELPSASLALSV